MKKITRFYQQNVIITGGSSGIGLATAIEFGKLGAKLFLLARDIKRLEQAKIHIHQQVGLDVEVFPISVDVGHAEDIRQAIQSIASDYHGIHTLINNAGIVKVGRFSDFSWQDLQQVMAVNYWGTVAATQAAWPYLLQAKAGHVGFVSSVAGFLGLLGYGAYAPPKFAMTGLVQCLWPEAKEHHIGMTIIYPPDTDTPQLTEENSQMLPQLAKIKKYGNVLSPQTVAAKFVKGILQYRAEVFCDWSSRPIRYLTALFPGWTRWLY